MIEWKTEWKKLLWIVAAFLVFFWLPVNWGRFTGGIMESLHLAKWYAREHVLLCLVPAFFIAGAIGVFSRRPPSAYSRPSIRRSMSPARSRTFKCFEIAGRDILNGLAISVTLAGPRVSRLNISRRVGSANAEKIAFSLDDEATIPYI